MTVELVPGDIYPKRREHSDAVWALTMSLQLLGTPTAMEVGIPGGRVDIVTYTDKSGEVPTCAIEVKTNRQFASHGVDQINKYGDILGVERRLLVVSREANPATLAPRAKAGGVDLWVVDFLEMRRLARLCLDKHGSPKGVFVMKPGEWPATTEAANIKRAAMRGGDAA